MGEELRSVMRVLTARLRSLRLVAGGVDMSKLTMLYNYCISNDNSVEEVRTVQERRDGAQCVTNCCFVDGEHLPSADLTYVRVRYRGTYRK